MSNSKILYKIKPLVNLSQKNHILFPEKAICTLGYDIWIMGFVPIWPFSQKIKLLTLNHTNNLFNNPGEVGLEKQCGKRRKSW